MVVVFISGMALSACSFSLTLQVGSHVKHLPAVSGSHGSIIHSRSPTRWSSAQVSVQNDSTDEKG